MNLHRLKIEMGLEDGPPYVGKIFIDGEELHGIRKLTYRAEAKEAPTLEIEMFCGGVEITSNGFVNIKDSECLECEKSTMDDIDRILKEHDEIAGRIDEAFTEE